MMILRTFAFPTAAFWGLAAVGFFLSACQTVPGGSDHLSRDQVSLEYIHQTLLERQSGINDLKSFVNTKVRGKKIRHSFRQVILVRDDNSLRIDTFNLFGQTLGVFIIDGPNTLLYDPGRNRLFRGRDVNAMLQRTIGINLDLRAYASVFFGNIPQLHQLKIIRGRLSEDRKQYQLTAIDPEKKGTVEIDLDAFTLLPSRVSRLDNGEPTYQVHWEDYRRVGDRDFPHRLTLELPVRGETMTLKYTDPTLNAGLPGDAFDLPKEAESLSLSRY